MGRAGEWARGRALWSLLLRALRAPTFFLKDAIGVAVVIHSGGLT
jgi:hypothetical protein